MSIEQNNYVVGVKKNEDDSLDYSRSAEMVYPHKSSLFEKNEAVNLLMRLRTANEFERGYIISHVAKEKNSTRDDVLNNMLELAKERILFPDKVMHYHRTSFDKFKSIVKTGRLLSRTNLKKLNPEIDIAGWSASDNVMMTTDVYDAEGKLIKPGITTHTVAGGDIIFAFGKNIVSSDNYNGIGLYPTMSDIPLIENCEAVLVKDENIIPDIKALLESSNITIPVYKEEEWIEKRYG